MPPTLEATILKPGLIMNQTTLFDLEAFTNSPIPTPIYDPAWDEPEPESEPEPDLAHSVGEQISESVHPCKNVGEQVTSDTPDCSSTNTHVLFSTKKSAPQHDIHWVERYWVERAGTKYWYFRYYWMSGRKINRLYLGSVNSTDAKRRKADIEVWIAEGLSPHEIKELISSWKQEKSPIRG